MKTEQSRFYCGWVRRDGEDVRVDVLPPRALWRGDFKTVEPDEKSWIVYMDGEEFARVARCEEVGGALGVAVARPAASGGLLSRLRGAIDHG